MKLRRVDRLAWAGAIACLACAALWAGWVEVPSGDRPATEAERVEIAKRLAGRESFWASEAKKAFPADVWSQRDHFHRQEWDALLEQARQGGLSPSSLVRGLDQELRERPHRRAVYAVPCRPRPFYD